MLGMIVEHAALAEQRVGAGLAGVGPERTVHAEAFADGAKQRQPGDGKGADQQQPVVPHRLADPGGGQPHAEEQFLKYHGTAARWSSGGHSG